MTDNIDYYHRDKICSKRRITRNRQHRCKPPLASTTSTTIEVNFKTQERIHRSGIRRGEKVRLPKNGHVIV